MVGIGSRLRAGLARVTLVLPAGPADELLADPGAGSGLGAAADRIASTGRPRVGDPAVGLDIGLPLVVPFHGGPVPRPHLGKRQEAAG